VPNATWKNVERAVGLILGFIREGPTGLAGADGITDRLVVQVKHRTDYPKYLWDWINDIREVKDCQRMPIVVFHGARRKYEHSLVIIRLDDFVHYVKGAGPSVDGVHAGEVLGVSPVDEASKAAGD
jgi:hypothetical protein